MDKGNLKQIVASFRDKQVMLLGDVMLDEFIYGSVSRISPEAPVPIVEFESHTFMPGGVANAAANIKALGAVPLLLGCIGEDWAGEALRDELANRDIGIAGLITDPSRPTILKSRVIAHAQQIVRIDRERRQPLGQRYEKKLNGCVKKGLMKADAVLISDYAKGTATGGLVRGIIQGCQRKSTPVVADSKGAAPETFRDVSVLTPNIAEATTISGISIDNEESLLDVGKHLLSNFNSKAILITRAEQGMSLFESNGEVVHIPAQVAKVSDVTGAGDTVAATLALALAAGATMKEAATLANLAAAVVVRKLGTATCTIEELGELI